MSTEYLLKLGYLRISHKVSQNVPNTRLFTSLRDHMDILSSLTGAPLILSSYTRLVVGIIILAARTISKKRQPEVWNVRSNWYLVCKWKFQMVSWGWRAEEETRPPPLPPLRTISITSSILNFKKKWTCPRGGWDIFIPSERWCRVMLVLRSLTLGLFWGL